MLNLLKQRFRKYLSNYIPCPSRANFKRSFKNRFYYYLVKFKNNFYHRMYNDGKTYIKSNYSVQLMYFTFHITINYSLVM